MKQVIEDILNNTILPEYEDLICGFEIKEPHERFDTMGNTPFKFISVTVTFIAGYGTKYWPITLSVRDKFDDIMNDIWDVIYNYTNIATDVYHKTVSKCEGKVEFMNEDYSPAGKKIIPNEIVVHKSNPIWRKNILETGLQVSVGECYKTYVGYGEKCIPAIFATNSTNKRAWFDSTYDDDIWFIDTKMIPDVKWYKDKHFESTKKHIVTFENIPPEALTLKYQGSGSDKFLKESENKKSNYVNVIKQLVEPFKNEDCVTSVAIVCIALELSFFHSGFIVFFNSGNRLIKSNLPYIFLFNSYSFCCISISVFHTSIRISDNLLSCVICSCDGNNLIVYVFILCIYL